jgi:hypothetical protein
MFEDVALIINDSITMLVRVKPVAVVSVVAAVDGMMAQAT